MNFLLDRREMIEVVSCDKTPPTKLLKLLTKLAEAHRAELLAQWEELRP